MRVLIVHRHFWPDTAPQASILRSIGSAWVNLGHEVDVMTGQPSYGGAELTAPAREDLDGLQVHRVRLLKERRDGYLGRAVNYGLFFVRTALAAVRGKYDLVVGLTAPPVVPGLVLGTAARLGGGRYLYHCLDIFPELNDARRSASRPSVLSSALRAIDARSMRLAARVVVLSEDMKDAVLARGVDPRRISVINNLDIEAFSEEPRPDQVVTPPPGTFNVLFAGNIGRFQNLSTVIDAAHKLADDKSIRFDFLGTGLFEQAIRKQAGDLVGRTVFFHGRVPPRAAALSLKHAGCALVSLDRGVIRYAHPSKTVTSLKAGSPILALVDSVSQLAKTIEREGLGRVVEPDDADALAAMILSLKSADRDSMSSRCLSYYERELSRETLLGRWESLIEMLDVHTARSVTK